VMNSLESKETSTGKPQTAASSVTDVAGKNSRSGLSASALAAVASARTPP
jgi:hypothetical protein